MGGIVPEAQVDARVAAINAVGEQVTNLILRYQALLLRQGKWEISFNQSLDDWTIPVDKYPNGTPRITYGVMRDKGVMKQRILTFINESSAETMLALEEHEAPGEKTEIRINSIPIQNVNMDSQIEAALTALSDKARLAEQNTPNQRTDPYID